MPVNNPTNSQQALGIADSVQHGNMTLANAGALRTGTTAADTALLQAYDNNTGPAYVTFATLTAGNTPTMDLSDSVTKAGGYIYRAGGTDIPLADGGTNASLVADNGGIFYSTATAAAILPSTSTANQPLLSGASGMPGWSTATYPGSTTINRILYSSANNVIGQITTANSGVLTTNSSGVPSIDTTNFQVLTTGVQVKGNNTNTAAPAGFIGEEIRSFVARTTVALTDATIANITSISLTAGLWSISAVGDYTSAATGTLIIMAISANSASYTGTVIGDSRINTPTLPTAAADISMTIPSLVVSLAGATTYYLVTQMNFTVGSPTCGGRISAIRIG